MADYPLPVFHFQVDWGGIDMKFSEVSGLNVEYEIIEYNEGTNPDYSSFKMPGRKKSSNIILKRGIFEGNVEFFSWWDDVKLNKIKRRTITITLMDQEHAPAMVWKIQDAWPVKVEGPSLKADGKEVAIESLELAHEGILIE